MLAEAGIEQPRPAGRQHIPRWDTSTARLWKDDARTNVSQNLTIMVKRKNVSIYDDTEPPDGEQGRVKIQRRTPIYSHEAVLAAAAGRVLPWTRDCVRTVRNLGFDHDDLAQLLSEALRHGRYKDSEWCEQTDAGPWAACDAYVLRRREWNENAFKYLECEYFIKLAVAKTGQVLLLVSCHT